MFSFNYKKAIQVINYFAIKNGGAINKLKVIKLIWLSDRYYLREFGRPIIGDQYYAMELGPIPSNTKDLMKEDNDFIPKGRIKYRDKFISPAGSDYKIKSKGKVDKTVFSKTDLMVLEKIHSNFGGNHKYKLSKFSHDYPEWKRFEESIKQDPSGAFPMDYIDFFEKPSINKHSLFNQDQDQLEVAKDIFIENSLLSFGNGL